MFENLTENLERAFKNIKGEGKITEINISETLKDVRRALVNADVNYKIAKDFINTVKQKALGKNVLTALKPKEEMMKIIYEELVALMGTEKVPVNTEGKPAVILMSGLQGSGKTTFSGKLAKYFAAKGKKPLLVADDVYRPAAINQLQVLGQSINIPVYAEPESKDTVSIARNAIEHAKANGFNLVIVDTAGRLAVDEEMMTEIANIKKAVNPQEILFVVDAMTGEDAINTAKAFNDRLDYSGVILTKMDGDTKGGAAISIRYVVDKPIKFIGSGEKLEDIQEFNPEGIASRILGAGDLQELLNRAQTIYDLEDAKELEKKIRSNKFDFDDFQKQISQIKKLGNLKDVASMIPGIGKAIKDVEISDEPFKAIEAIIGSMTPYERHNPACINASRRNRIAKGSGTTLQEVNNLLKQFEQTKKMMNMASKMNPKKAMAQMKQLKQMQNRGGRR